MSGVLVVEHKENDPITLTRFVLAERKKFPQATGNFAMLLQSIQLACKVISRATSKAGIANMYGVAGGTNTSGDVQKKLDVLADECFISALTYSDEVSIMGSEEHEQPIVVESTAGGGGYAVVFDPLDGSSNIDANVAIGTIFGIYRKLPSSEKPTIKDLLRPGVELLAAGYAVYGAATMLTLTTGNGVNSFTLDPSLGEFILTHPDIRIPSKGTIYSINEANENNWDEPTKAFISHCKKTKDSKARYVGSMVSDVHRTLLYGGVFCYPADKKNPDGKLRLLYECNPIALLMEQAGGKATTGTQRVLEVKPNKLHQRCAIFCGSSKDVEKVEEFYKAKGQPKAKL